MRAAFQLFAILLVALPLKANAFLYKFEYTGHVFYLTGNGMGYNMDDSIKGTLIFDLSDSKGDIWAENYIVDYYGKTGADFVRGYQPENIGQNIDNVRVYDAVDANYSVPRLDAGFDITDANHVTYGPKHSRTYGVNVNVVFDDFDWLSVEGKINTFAFTDADQLALTDSAGVFYDLTFATDSNGKPASSSNDAWFRLNSASLSVVDVPEPPIWFLSMLGLFALFMRRRSNARRGLTAS